jgi:hypothetical protein
MANIKISLKSSYRQPCWRKLFLTLTSLFIFPQYTNAASCGGIFLPNTYEEADVIFTGSLIHEYRNDKHINYQFKIDRIWKDNFKEITITEHIDTLYFPVMFIENDPVVVYAFKNNEVYGSSSCVTRSLNYINSLSRAVNSYHSLYIPTHEDILDSLSNQNDLEINKRKAHIIATITSIKPRDVLLNNNKKHTLMIYEIDKGTQDGIFIGMDMFFVKSKYFYHSLEVIDAKQNSSLAMYYCNVDKFKDINPNPCENVDLSKLHIGSIVYSNQKVFGD